MTSNTVDIGKSDFYGWAFACPYDDRQTDCPFETINLFSKKEKVEWIDNLDERKLGELACHHRECENKLTFKRNKK